MNITGNKKIFFSITAVYLLAAIVCIASFGLKPSIEFSGGTLIEVSSENESLTKENLQGFFEDRDITPSIQSFGENGFLIRTPFLDEDTQTEITDSLASTSTDSFGASIDRVSSIGPTIGSELKTKAATAIVIVSIIIILFIAFAFRKVSKPVSSWTYGIVAIITLLHDVLLPTGVFALLGYFLGFEVDVLFVMALLAILGYSVNDTIVVFDRIRENLRDLQENKKEEVFEETVERSLKQTFARSFNTSFTTVLVLLALYIFGPDLTNHFALTLLVGAIAGTYSSIFLASPLLVWIEERKRAKEEESKK